MSGRKDGVLRRSDFEDPGFFGRIGHFRHHKVRHGRGRHFHDLRKVEFLDDLADDEPGHAGDGLVRLFGDGRIDIPKQAGVFGRNRDLQLHHDDAEQAEVGETTADPLSESVEP